jgi:hypothetical protein
MSVLGLTPKTLKQLNGDKFAFPLASMVLAKAIGRGATAVSKIRCRWWCGILWGSMEDI